MTEEEKAREAVAKGVSQVVDAAVRLGSRRPDLLRIGFLIINALARGGIPRVVRVVARISAARAREELRDGIKRAKGIR